MRVRIYKYTFDDVCIVLYFRLSNVGIDVLHAFDRCARRDEWVVCGVIVYDLITRAGQNDIGIFGAPPPTRSALPPLACCLCKRLCAAPMVGFKDKYYERAIPFEVCGIWSKVCVVWNM